MPKESQAAYDAFLVYRNMAKPRSIREVARSVGKYDSLIERWSSRHKWVERALLWDNAEQRIADDEALRKHQLWERRRLDAIERRYARAMELDQRAQQMLAMPILRKVKEERDDKGNVKLVVFEPAGWRQRDAALMLQLANALEREAIEAAIPPKVQDDRKPDKVSSATAEAMIEAASRLEDDYDPPSDIKN